MTDATPEHSDPSGEGQDAGARTHDWRPAAVIAAVTVAIGLSIWIWEDYLENRVLPKRWGTVVEGKLYRSGQLHPVLIERTLRDHEIDAIVSLNELPPEADEERAEVDASSLLGIDRWVFPLVGDGTGDPANYVAAVAAIDESMAAGDRVLVHCAAGSYRTGGVVAIYRVLVEGWSTEDALEEMADFDWEDSNPILPTYLDENLPVIAQGLLEQGVIESIPDPLPRFSR